MVQLDQQKHWTALLGAFAPHCILAATLSLPRDKQRLTCQELWFCKRLCPTLPAALGLETSLLATPARTATWGRIFHSFIQLPATSDVLL